MNIQAEILLEILTPNQMLELKKKLNTVRDIPIADFIEEYIQRKSITGKPSYINRSIKPFRNKFINRFGTELPISSAIKRDAEDFIFEDFHTEYARWLAKSVGRAMWNWGIEREYISVNIFSHIKLPKPQKPDPVIIPDDILKKIVSNFPKQLRDIYIVFRNTGLRASELLSLTWEDVSLRERIIKVGSRKFSTKSRKVRLVSINETVFDILSKMLSQKIPKKVGYIFTKSNGFPYSVNYISKRFKKTCRQLKLSESYHLHCLRATFCCDLIRKGVPIFTVSKILGHFSCSVTEEHYLMASSDDIKSAIEKIEFK